MKSKSVRFEAQPAIAPEAAPNQAISDRRQQIRQWMEQCRAKTLALFEQVDETTFCCQAHDEFSPIGWHLGHIAFTEALWLLERLGGRSPLFPEYRCLFAADGLPKNQRVHLPPFPEIQHYLEVVRHEVFAELETAPLDEQERLWRWLIQHESQHSETITLVLQLQRWAAGHRPETSSLPQPSVLSALDEMICIPSGEFSQGNDSLDALDNERPVHSVYLPAYWIDRYPVTCGQYRTFIESGGYQVEHWWSPEGWNWLQANAVTQPLYWLDDPRWDDHPVCGVSWYEADAYARFVGKRLPTEAEWEKAASWDSQTNQRRPYPWGDQLEPQHCNHHHLIGHTTPVNAYPAGQSPYGCYDMLGNVWEWTASWFDGYLGFEHYPYRGYSQVYFDGQHRVLRGGSWATYPWGLRAAFRNWYHPGMRQILAGFRCVRDEV